MPPSKLRRVLGALEQKAADSSGEPPMYAETCAILAQQQAARRSTDWICEFGPDMFILYGCVQCGLYPLRSSSWYRQVKKVQPGQTDEGGYWRCANCLKKWKWSDSGKLRLIVIGDGEADTETFLAMIGNANDEQEAQINFLKGCKMLTQLGGRPVTKEMLLTVIWEMNERANGRLGKLASVVRFTSRLPDNTDGFALYCEDARLSMRNPGTERLAIDLGRVGDCPSNLSSGDLSMVIEAAAAFLDFENAKPATKPDKKALTYFSHNDRVRDMRHRLVELQLSKI
jgi:hypothetical protein